MLRPRVDENTPLLAGPSSQSVRRKTISLRRSSSRRHRRSADVSECSNSQSDLDDSTHHTSSPLSSSRNLRPGSLRSHSSATFDGATNMCHSPLETIYKPIPRQEQISGAPVVSHPRSFLPNLDISLRLQNSGSVARDHLASERTFLAYMRTSLAIASSGVALVQLFSAASASTPEGSTHRLHTYIRPLGASTIGVGILVLLIGVVRYFKIQFALTKGYFPVSRIATGFIALMLSVLVTMTFAILLAGKMEPRRD